MDDFNVSSLHESKNEWGSRLLNILTPCMIDGFQSIWNEAYKLCKENDEMDKCLLTFQNLITRIPKWNPVIVEEERKRICEKSGCGYLEDLITCVHIIQLKILTCMRVGSKQKKIDKNRNGKIDGQDFKMLRKGKVDEDEFQQQDSGEYDREGEMADQDLETAEDAAEELRSILSADENLPEWVQAKITKAVDYLDTARDYMQSKDQEPDLQEGWDEMTKAVKDRAEAEKRLDLVDLLAEPIRRHGLKID
jgi:hypothetical protein